MKCLKRKEKRNSFYNTLQDDFYFVDLVVEGGGGLIFIDFSMLNTNPKTSHKVFKKFKTQN